tara:strand:+ start:9111 stop:10088 length:978 start_codon:yes stop_codon:yes gene_type:complete
MIKKYFELKNTNINLNYLYLIHGKNEGLQKQILDENFLKNFKGAINKYEQNEFIENYKIILNEILTKSLFENEKVIIVSRTDDKIYRYIEEILDKNLKDIKIIFKSDILEKKSKLRNLFEKNNSLVAIPVYPDDAKSLSLLVIEFINKNNIKLSRESINLLVDRSQGDRAILKLELEKILNYSLTNKKIDILNIKNLTNLSENYSVNELADNYLAKNNKIVAKILNENNYSDEDCILIIRTLLGKSKRLMNIIERYNETKNLNEVISNIKPPIFWKDKDIVKKQANSWKIKDLKNKIYNINEVEAMVKGNSKSSLNLLSDFIVNY